MYCRYNTKITLNFTAMKKLLLLFVFAGIVLAGYALTGSSNEANVATTEQQVMTDAEAAQTTNYLSITQVEGSSWVVTSQYPVASTLTIVCDGPSTPGMEYTMSAGSSRIEVRGGSDLMTIAEVWPSSDATYTYSW